MRNIKLLTGIICLTISLSGCFGSKDEESTESSNASSYSNEEISMLLDENWETLESERLPSSVPSEILVAFQSNSKNDKYTANLNISKVELENEISSEDFAINSIRQVEGRLLSFNETARENIEVEISGDEADAIRVEFEGKQAASDPVIRFTQIYVTNENNAYTFTSSYLPSEDESIVNQAAEMLNSIAIK